MLKLLVVWLNTLLLLFSITSPAATPHFPKQDIQQEQIINDIIADYAVLSAWLGDVYPNEDLLISKSTNDLVSAAKFLEAGFSTELAQTMAANWSEYLPEQGLLAIIPTDSIPLITGEDWAHLSVRLISTNQAVVQRVYRDIYWPGDAYLYQIISNNEKGRWIISDIRLLPLDFLP